MRMNSRLRWAKYGICVESSPHYWRAAGYGLEEGRDLAVRVGTGVSRHVQLLGSEGEQCDRCAIAITGVSPVVDSRSKSSNLVAATDQEFVSCICEMSFPAAESLKREGRIL